MTRCFTLILPHDSINIENPIAKETPESAIDWLTFHIILLTDKEIDEYSMDWQLRAPTITYIKISFEHVFNIFWTRDN